MLEEETESRRFSIHRLAHYCRIQFVDIYVALSDAEGEQYQRDCPEATKAMASCQTQFEQIGEQRGKQIGEAAMLLRLVEIRIRNDDDLPDTVTLMRILLPKLSPWYSTLVSVTLASYFIGIKT
ncbi:hypothetical protein [Candidatus Thiodictyon syntrophicum]|uniref:Uncharacterized protein n=1 Tax=Candidatus Thiodictyon syntrophicum TaxID=1166950 RepID=A0A2K8U4N3_9GAMM|nr:hypothetical protein [Candidatus Thiodictyon syntrophicum]AUB80495.1 hypothetical protein THSYN_05730 [Candidatus Thiodictyon syntrophicum]